VAAVVPAAEAARHAASERDPLVVDGTQAVAALKCNVTG
jgi:hypothetical protein